MSAQALAALHARCFTIPPPWSAESFAASLGDPACHLEVTGAAPTGFALFRLVLDEAELLTLAVAPEARRAGLGRAVLSRGLEAMRSKGARRCYLEVAASNAPAIALYHATGFRECARRPGYYRSAGTTPCDALVFRAELG
ncbi:MAG: ribosomal-protein-alanine N-acetyltransferase [Rhodobacteraceae bacterium]|nr:MAG: ribosomal-protein-alanine N-acetyltransferase [Paracoccaceae bacterium]